MLDKCREISLPLHPHQQSVHHDTIRIREPNRDPLARTRDLVRVGPMRAQVECWHLVHRMRRRSVTLDAFSSSTFGFAAFVRYAFGLHRRGLCFSTFAFAALLRCAFGLHRRGLCFSTFAFATL